ncbi:MAG: IclR family transcriptional regulator [Pseudomonadota bacterium]
MATIQSVQRALKILSFFSLPRVSLGIGEMSDLLGVPRGTVHGLVRTLVQEGFLRQDPETRKYRLGFKLYEQGSILASSLEINQKANDPSHELAVRTRLDVRIVVWDGETVLFTMGASGRSLPLFQAGPRAPAYCTASGRAILASLSLPELHEYLEGTALIPYTPATITDRDAFLKEIEATRSRGYAISREEYLRGRNALAVTVFGRNECLAGAISISGTTDVLLREQEDDLAGELIKTATDISRRMGYYPEEIRRLGNQ